MQLLDRPEREMTQQAAEVAATSRQVVVARVEANEAVQAQCLATVAKIRVAMDAISA